MIQINSVTVCEYMFDPMYYTTCSMGLLEFQPSDSKVLSSEDFSCARTAGVIRHMEQFTDQLQTKNNFNNDRVLILKFDNWRRAKTEFPPTTSQNLLNCSVPTPLNKIPR